MPKTKTITVAQLIRFLGLDRKLGEQLAKDALAHLSGATVPNGRRAHAPTISRKGRGVSGKAGAARRAAPKRFRLVKSATKGIRQVKSPLSQSNFGIKRIRDAVVKASITK